MVGNTDNNRFGSDIDALFSQHGISSTQQRRQIARILLSKPQHLSADQILERVNQENAIASKATIYNTLGLFARKGLIREVIIDPSKVFYDSNTNDHHHIYHVDTGMLVDVHPQELALQNHPTTPDGTELERVDIIVRVRSKG